MVPVNSDDNLSNPGLEICQCFGFFGIGLNNVKCVIVIYIQCICVVEYLVNICLYLWKIFDPNAFI